MPNDYTDDYRRLTFSMSKVIEATTWPPKDVVLKEMCENDANESVAADSGSTDEPGLPQDGMDGQQHQHAIPAELWE